MKLFADVNGDAFFIDADPKDSWSHLTDSEIEFHLHDLAWQVFTEKAETWVRPIDITNFIKAVRELEKE